MRDHIKRFWGCLPVVSFGIVVLVIAGIQRKTGESLRSIPLTLLIWMGIFSALILGCYFFVPYRNRLNRKQVAISWALRKMLVGLGAFMISCGFFATALLYHPERVVTRYRMRVVAIEDHYCNKRIHYFEYKNGLFYGQERGFEEYDTNGDDTLSKVDGLQPDSYCFYDRNGNVIACKKSDQDQSIESKKENVKENALGEEKMPGMKVLAIKVIGSDKKSACFNISLDDFITSYNGYYGERYHKAFLCPASKWAQNVYEKAEQPHGQMYNYTFKAEPDNWRCPILSVERPADEDHIERITLEFDDHSFSEEAYEAYEELCFYTLKVLFADLTDEQITSVYQSINDRGYGEPRDETDDLGTSTDFLYEKDGIGMYTEFIRGGRLCYCIIPVTQEKMNDYIAKGTQVYEIDKEINSEK